MYTYTFGGKGGKKSTLRESNDKVVVRTRNARSLEDAVVSEEGKQILEGFIVDQEFPEADVTVLKSRDFTPDDTSTRDHARSVLKNEPELRFAGRVLVDSGTQNPVLYTENIFIKFFDEVAREVCEKILNENNLTIKQKVDFASNAYFVSALESIGVQVFELSESLLNRQEIEFCHPELIRKKGFKAIHSLQWHLKQTSIQGVSINAHVNADLAHQVSQGEGVIIAVIDDGVDIDHPEFSFPGKVVSSRDITLNSNDPRPKYTYDKHGTACAGVALASGLNASGVAPKAVLMPIRLNANIGSIAEANAFRWATDHGADIISCSWGPEDGAWDDLADPLHHTMVEMPDSTRLAIEDATSRGRNGKGCVITFAAGNGNEDTSFDGYASSPHVIAVAACNDTNTRSVYSDYGSQVWCSFPSKDFGHPPFNHPDPLTSGIYTTDRIGGKGYNMNGDYYKGFGGTSSSCPGVAGTVALILSVNPDLSWQQVKDILRDTSVKIDLVNGQYDAQGHSKYYGYGKVDAEQAVQKALDLKLAVADKKVKIIAALVDPAGSDTGNEKISILNTSDVPVDMNNWAFEVKNRKQSISGILAGGEARTITLDGSSVKLANTGGTIHLINALQEKVHSVSYLQKQVKRGILIEFH